MSKRLCSIAAALLLGGCMSMAPTYERPAAPIADAYPAQAGAPGTPAAEVPWQQFFADPRLRALIAAALQNNRDLRIALLAIDRARAQYGVQRADQLPTLGIGVAGAREPAGDGEVRVYSAGVQLSSYEIDLWGRVRSLSDSAFAQYLATEEGRRAAQISLIGSVARAYYAALADAELIALSERTLATRSQTLDLTKLRFQYGTVSEIDVRQAVSLAEGARAALAQAQRLRAQDENLLALLVGVAQPARTEARQTLAEAADLPPLPAGLPSELLVRRPDIRQAEQQLLSANARIGAARAAFFPRISLTASGGVASTELSELFSGGNGAWTFAANLLQPIFDGGRLQSNLEIAQADRDIAVAQYEKAIQTAFREVADALAGRDTLGEQLQAQLAQAQAEAARYQLAELRYRAGVASFLDQLDAQRALFAAQVAAVKVRLAMIQNQVTLYQVLGGGWSH